MVVAHSQSKRSLKPNNLALMIKIDWTEAKVVNFTALKTVQLQSVTMNTKERAIRAVSSVTMYAGQAMYLSRSESVTGYYYFNCVNEAGVVTCTCPHYTAKHACPHQAAVLAVYESKKARERQAVASEFTGAVEQLSETTASEVESTSTPKIEEAKHELATVQAKLDSLTNGKAPAEVLASADCTEELRARIWKAINAREKARAKVLALEYWQRSELQKVVA